MPAFGLVLPARVRFGRGAALDAVPEIARLGTRIALVHGQSTARAAPLISALAAAGATVLPLSCPAEPTLDMLEAALAEARTHRPDSVVAIGGGAALDLGKALAALLPADRPPLDHLEVVGQGLPLSADPLPFVAIPTTAGTGSEATRNAVIGVPAHRRKVSLRDDRLVSRLAVIDPALTDGAPREVTLASGLDALTQVIEPYLSARATPFTNALCHDAIPRGLAALAALGAGENPAARDTMAYVAHVSGIALTNAGLGAVHGLAGVLGGETGEAHGVICGRLLPHVLMANRAACIGDALRTDRFGHIEHWCRETLGCGIAGMEGWAAARGLAPPDQRLAPEALADIATRSAASSSMKANPVALSAATLAGVLSDAGWG
ncbi:iron-containing alcohol dehydrogenase [Rhodovulum iodosum]|uniref:iron-containing alcohol dehydrogenase n=1 Tax=Rhodovulum iodosum TaxID=68291 RepID=UPI00147602D9|nr:iron-containing alcohol dehydrogenase [Rhodovulum robiginosum]